MSQPALGPTGSFQVPTLQPPNLGVQSNGFQMTSAAMPGRPDFTPYFGKPLREIKTNPYEACVSITASPPTRTRSPSRV